MYRVSEDMFAEIAEMNQTAQQNFIKSQSEPYGPGEMDSLLRIIPRSLQNPKLLVCNDAEVV